MSEALEVIDPQPPQQGLALFGSTDPIAVLGQASRVALALASVIKKQELFTVIQGREHVRVEGWTLLGSMLGVFPRVEWTRKLENGWEARVEVVVASTGAVIGAGEAECLRSESTWSKRDDYALRGMAQTRAVSRAMRGPLGFVVQLAGFATTPAEEMPSDAEIAKNAERIGEDFKRTRAVPPSPTPPPASSSAPPQSSPQEVLERSRGHAKPAYADDDAVCGSCGRKEALRPHGNPRFCAKAEGGCGAPRRGESLELITYGEFKTR